MRLSIPVIQWYTIAQRLAADLSSELALNFHWVKIWLVAFNASKSKLRSLRHLWSDPELPAISTNGCPLVEVLCLERRYGLKLTHDFKFNSDIRSIRKDAGKNCRLPNVMFIGYSYLTKRSFYFYFLKTVYLFIFVYNLNIQEIILEKKLLSGTIRTYVSRGEPVILSELGCFYWPFHYCWMLPSLRFVWFSVDYLNHDPVKTAQLMLNFLILCSWSIQQVCDGFNIY